MRPSKACATYRDISHALRRDDLAVLETPGMDIHHTVDDPWRRGSMDTVSVELLWLDDSDVLVQCLRELDDFDGEDAAYLLTPLSFGPVQEVSHASV
jgi:hypothetical protein